MATSVRSSSSSASNCTTRHSNRRTRFFTLYAPSTRRRRYAGGLTTAALALALALLGGCSGDGSPSPPTAAVGSETTTTGGPVAQPCDDLLAEGVATDKATMGTVCRRADGTLHANGTTTEACLDGRTILWNDVGWGYIGEPWRLHAAALEAKVPPAAELEGCTGA